VSGEPENVFRAPLASRYKLDADGFTVKRSDLQPNEVTREW